MDSKKVKVLFVIICTLQLLYLFHFRSAFKYEIIKNPFKQSSGISYAVSPEIIESNDLLKKWHANDFNLSKSLSKINTYFYQRSIEFNYPIRINKTSKFIFFPLDENIPVTCKIIETGKYLKLTRC